MSDLKNLLKEIPYKYRMQNAKYGKATLVAYIDSRDVQDILDEVVGPENWQSDYKVINNNLFAGIGITVNGNVTWKWDCGTESAVEKEKGEASDALIFA